VNRVKYGVFKKKKRASELPPPRPVKPSVNHSEDGGHGARLALAPLARARARDARALIGCPPRAPQQKKSSGPLNAYQKFCKEARPGLKKDLAFGDAQRALSKLWKEMDDGEKVKYGKSAAQKKEAAKSKSPKK
jgi:hypothetical protein